MMREWREDYPSTGESSSGGIFLDEATWELQPITLDEYLANGRDFSIFRNISDEQYESIVQDWHERDLDPATRAYYFRVTVRNAIPWDELETRRDYRFDTMVFKEVDGERAGEWSQMTLDGEPLSE